MRRAAQGVRNEGPEGLVRLLQSLEQSALADQGRVAAACSSSSSAAAACSNSCRRRGSRLRSRGGTRRWRGGRGRQRREGEARSGEAECRSRRSRCSHSRWCCWCCCRGDAEGNEGQRSRRRRRRSKGGCRHGRQCGRRRCGRCSPSDTESAKDRSRARSCAKPRKRERWGCSSCRSCSWRWRLCRKDGRWRIRRRHRRERERRCAPRRRAKECSEDWGNGRRPKWYTGSPRRHGDTERRAASPGHRGDTKGWKRHSRCRPKGRHAERRHTKTAAATCATAANPRLSLRFLENLGCAATGAAGAPPDGFQLPTPCEDGVVWCQPGVREVAIAATSFIVAIAATSGPARALHGCAVRKKTKYQVKHTSEPGIFGALSQSLPYNTPEL